MEKARKMEGGRTGAERKEKRDPWRGKRFGPAVPVVWPG